MKNELCPTVRIAMIVSALEVALPIIAPLGINLKLAYLSVPFPPLTANGSGIICFPT